MWAHRAGFGLLGNKSGEGADVILFLLYERADFGKLFAGFDDVWVLGE